MESAVMPGRTVRTFAYPYRLGTRSLQDELRDVMRGRLSHAIGVLRGGGDPAHAVHEARKDMKKARSALRLVRSGLEPEAYRRENDRYRQISRGLARFRDADAMIECLGELEEWAGEHHRFSGLRAALLEEARSGRRDGSLRAAAARAAAELRRGLDRVGSLDLPEGAEVGEEVLGDGLERALRRGRRRLERIDEDPSDERFHDWRKRAKDLWYQRELTAANPVLAERAHTLSSLLGDDHDLAVLREEAERRVAEFSWRGEHDLLIDLIVRRRDRLQGDALRIGRPIYAESQERTSAALRSGGNTG
jgi:CHAD domain-containing protein